MVPPWPKASSRLRPGYQPVLGKAAGAWRWRAWRTVGLVDPAGRLAGQGDAGRLAEPVPLRHPLDRLAAVAALLGPEVVAQVVEEYVVGGGQRARDVQRPQRLVGVVVEGAPPDAAGDGEAARVVDDGVLVDQPVVERRRRGDQLEGRPRRVQARDRPVEQRLVRGRVGQAAVV